MGEGRNDNGPTDYAGVVGAAALLLGSNIGKELAGAIGAIAEGVRFIVVILQAFTLPDLWLAVLALLILLTLYVLRRTGVIAWLSIAAEMLVLRLRWSQLSAQQQIVCTYGCLERALGYRRFCRPPHCTVREFRQVVMREPWSGEYDFDDAFRIFERARYSASTPDEGQAQIIRSVIASMLRSWWNVAPVRDRLLGSVQHASR
jgi:hypothetical protein